MSVLHNRPAWKPHLTAHNWQKWKRVFLTCPCHKIYRDEGSKKLQKYLKNYDICENVEFGAISWKCDILSITALLKLEFKQFFCTCVTHIITIIWSTANFVSTLSIFSYI